MFFDSVNGPVANAIRAALAGLWIEVPSIKIDTARRGMGDVAFCAIPVASARGILPQVLATQLAERLADSVVIESATAVNGFVNIKLRPAHLFAEAIQLMQEKTVTTTSPERIIVEYWSPNTNKPLHLGHLRNGSLGAAVANLLEARGHTVMRANLINDRGIHICKSMLAYQKFGEGSTPESMGMKGDHFVGMWYVRFDTEEKKEDKPNPKTKSKLLLEAEEMLLKWEQGDLEVWALWQKMNAWVYKGFEATMTRFGSGSAYMYYESDLYTSGKDIVERGVASKHFYVSGDGATLFDLPKEWGTNKNGQKRVQKLLNPDGTSLYMTQDLGTAVKKANDFAPIDRSIYVVASEQDNHFKVLFEILRRLGYSWAEKCHHLSYGMVELPEGRMKSRQGTVVDADDLIDHMTKLACEPVRERMPELSEVESMRRGEVIALAAIKFYLLRVRNQSKILFDPKQSLSFVGDTGPYCLYTYARTKSLLARAESAGITPASAFSRLGTDAERAVALELCLLPLTIEKAAEGYAPAPLAERMLSLAGAFNHFYMDHPVLSEDVLLTEERVALVAACAEGLSWGLSLLGIEVLEQM